MAPPPAHDELDTPTVGAVTAPSLVDDPREPSATAANASARDATDTGAATLQLANAIAARLRRAAHPERASATRGPGAPLEALESVAVDTVAEGSFGASEPALVTSIDVRLPERELDEFAARYPLRRTLGRGGMGEVQLRHDDRIGRDVAVKLMHAGAADDALARARFLREARVQGQLEHPSVVPVYDLATTDDGELYFTMKRVRGLTLEQVLKALRAGDEGAHKRFTRRRLLTAFASLCLAVDFAHARGVLHRDLKPANVMFGDFGEVHVLDWGIAKLVGERDASPTDESPTAATAPRGDARDEGDATAHEPEPTSAWRAGPLREVSDGASQGTVAGALVGTPGYMAPEQARGDLDRVDARSDVYALGVLLFELLAGVKRHRGANLVQVLVSTLEARPEAPSAHDPTVPPELDAVVLKATAGEPAARYGSARALGEAVERYLDGDRDAALRRALATEHLGRARAQVSRARDERTSDDEADRARLEAVRETSQALAFDPAHDEARALLAELLVEPPRRTPPAVERELEELHREARRAGARAGAVRHFMWLTLAPFLFWMGVRAPGPLALGLGMVLVAALTGYYMHRSGNVSAAWSGLLLVMSSAAMSIMAGVLGPFVVVPALAATNAMFYSIHVERRWRVGVLAVSCAGMLGPWLAEVLGVLPPSLAVLDGRLTLLPRLTHHNPTAVQCWLVVAHTALIITPSIMVGRVRDRLLRSERAVVLQAWQLRQLLPRGPRARDGSSAAAASDASASEPRAVTARMEVPR